MKNLKEKLKIFLITFIILFSVKLQNVKAFDNMETNFSILEIFSNINYDNGTSEKIVENGSYNVIDGETFFYTIENGNNDIESATVIINGTTYPLSLNPENGKFETSGIVLEEGSYDVEIIYVGKNGSTFSTTHKINTLPDPNKFSVFYVENENSEKEIHEGEINEVKVNQIFSYRIPNNGYQSVSLNIDGREYSAKYVQENDSWIFENLQFTNPGNFTATIEYITSKGNMRTFKYYLSVKGILVSTGSNFNFLLSIIFSLLLPQFLINKNKKGGLK